LSTDLVLRLIGIFEAAGVQYMLVGSYSSNYYGRPRATKDADFVVLITPDQLDAVARALGNEFKVDHQMSFETITMTTRYIIKHPATAFTIELFVLSSDAHDQERFQRRQHVDFEGKAAWLPTAEDVVVTKLRWSKAGKRSKDVDDVARVLAVRGSQLDLDYIRHWCDQHGTRSLFEQLLEESRRFEPEQP
jgi:hypothetical protein